MEAFPFNDSDWEAIREAARAVTNAALAEDSALRKSRFADLQAVLAVQRERYGDHPTLLETEADFADDVPVRLALYEQAKQAAVEHDLPTISIRVSMARLFLEELGQPSEARNELLACSDELANDEEWNRWNREQWSELLVECVNAKP